MQTPLTFAMMREYVDYLRRVAIKQNVPAGMRQREFLDKVQANANVVTGYILMNLSDKLAYEFADEHEEFLPEGRILVNLLIKSRNE